MEHGECGQSAAKSEQKALGLALPPPFGKFCWGEIVSLESCVKRETSPGKGGKHVRLAADSPTLR